MDTRRGDSPAKGVALGGDPIVKPIRRKREKVCDFCTAVYTCSRNEHGRSPEGNLGQMRLFFESIRKDPSEENSLNFDIDLQLLRK